MPTATDCPKLDLLERSARCWKRKATASRKLPLATRLFLQSLGALLQDHAHLCGRAAAGLNSVDTLNYMWTLVLRSHRRLWKEHFCDLLRHLDLVHLSLAVGI